MDSLYLTFDNEEELVTNLETGYCVSRQEKKSIMQLTVATDMPTIGSQ